MENIQNWFEEQKESNPEQTEIIDNIITGISDRGFDSSQLNRIIQSKIESIASDYDSGFNTEVIDEA
jgi:hypothetical protein